MSFHLEIKTNAANEPLRISSYKQKTYGLKKIHIFQEKKENCLFRLPTLFGKSYKLKNISHWFVILLGKSYPYSFENLVGESFR